MRGGMTFDVIVVGAGIVGLAHAYEARRRGLSVAVVERDHRAVGASIRNFGFVTVTGQRAGDTWRRARRSRDVWAEVAPQAGIRIEHRGLWVLAQRPAAAEVLHAFMQTEMGERCELHSAREAGQHMPALRTEHATAALYSPHELRVESRDAIPRLTHWLSQEHGVEFFFGEAVLSVSDGEVHTAQRSLQAERIVLCPGTELTGVAGALLKDHGLQLTRLQMLRVQPEAGFRLGAAVMSDLSLVRYAGYAALPQAAALQQQLSHEVPHSLAHGIHLIAVQSADGSLVVGDSHHAADSPLPFASEAVDELILQHLYETLDLGQCRVVERWVGVYPVGHHEDCLVVRPSPSQRLVLVTSGTGASTAFGIAEDVFNQW
jgi:FAD dependent oxidoreductase TIGR03364